MNQPATIDIHNPFYCPALPAAAYLQTLRRTLMLGIGYQQSNNLFYAFARMLDRSNLIDGESANFIYDSERDWIVGVNLGNRRRGPAKQRLKTGRSAQNLGQLPAFRHSPNANVEDLEFTLLDHPKNLQSTAAAVQRMAKRKRGLDSSSSDMTPPVAKYAKSVLLANDSDFELEVKREKVNFDATGSPTLIPSLTGNSRQSGDATTFFKEASLAEVVKKVLDLLPGIRLEERLAKINDITVQKVADFLAENGYMNHCVLNVFRSTELVSLCLDGSLSDEDGLNICRQDVIRSFGEYNSFQHLEELSFCGARVEDFNLIHIHHLPKLSGLYLTNTGIGNEAVYLLVALKRTLKKLSIASNPDVNSDSASALLLLVNLEWLSIIDTGIDMVGLRIIGRTIFEESRVIDIQIPYACDAYIDNIDSMYLVDLKAPLIANPEACDALSIAALKKNLTAHAEKNPSIVTSGTREEMVSRLQDILARRKEDLIIAQMLLGA